MNRSFLLIIIPAVAVAVGYVLVLRWLGYELEALPFIVAGLAVVAAVLIVQWQLRRKARRSR